MADASTPPSQQRIDRRALILLGVMTLVWGTNWPMFPLAIQEVSVWTFRSVALPVTGLILLMLATWRGESLRVPREHWSTLIWVSLCYMVVWNIAGPLSTTMIASGQTAVLGFTMPLWVALLAWPVLGERFTPRLFIALVLGIASVALLMVPSFGAYSRAPLGVALGLLAGFGWAVGTIIQKRHPVPLSPIVVAGWLLMLTSIPIWFGAAIVAEGPWFMPSWQTIGVIAYISLVPMTIGNICWFSIVGRLPASLAGLSTILVPIVAMVSGAVFRGEPLGVLQLAAMACSATALALVVMRRPLKA